MLDVKVTNDPRIVVIMASYRPIARIRCHSWPVQILSAGAHCQYAMGFTHRKMVLANNRANNYNSNITRQDKGWKDCGLNV
jgi:hypothetical protein